MVIFKVTNGKAMVEFVNSGIIFKNRTKTKLTEANVYFMFEYNWTSFFFSFFFAKCFCACVRVCA